MPFTRRLLIFTLLWLLTGVACAILPEFNLEAGDSEGSQRLQLVFAAPFICATGVASTLVDGHAETWQQRDHLQRMVFGLVLAVYAVLALFALTRTARRPFILLMAVQVLVLVSSVACVLKFYSVLAE